jgi:hypothetical protein
MYSMGRGGVRVILSVCGWWLVAVAAAELLVRVPLPAPPTALRLR